MDKSREILSEITIFNKYARYIPEKQRRESWREIVDRNVKMHLEKFPELKEDIEWAYQYVFDKKVLPSMRSIQFAGRAAEVNPARLYNCSYLAINDYRAFNESLFLLLSGVGVGFSVQDHHVEQLPEIRKPNRKFKRRYLINDSISGWADAIKALMKSYFGMTSSTIVFDYSDIREKGAPLVTSGGKAPGPQPLKEAIVKIEGILSNKNDGDKLTPTEVLDIMCHLADSVLTAGIRRAALICLFSLGNKSMASAKSGNWWELNPQRGRANMSSVVVRSRATREVFDELWEYTKASGAGEPGIVWTNNAELGVNPCVEISLKDMQMCNLTTINASNIESQEDYNNRARAASIIGTLQASYTDFHYLRGEWKRNCEKDALLGVSMTGIASMKVFYYSQREAAEVVVNTNAEFAKKIGINEAARCTAVKPEGTASLVVGSSSGIHAWHNDYYLRRMRINKTEPLYTYLLINLPEILEDDYYTPDTTAVITVPQKAPDNAVLRNESSIQLLNRVRNVTNNWVKTGFRNGYNHHNVSCTVSVKNDEWDAVADWMWINRDNYSGISVLPYDTGTYKQTPFENCSKEEYERRIKLIRDIDLTKVVEVDNNTRLSDQAACGGGNCEIL